MKIFIYSVECRNGFDVVLQLNKEYNKIFLYYL